MKSGIHPDYHEINVIMTDGTEYKTRSCYGQPGATLRLDVDPKSHPAWTGVQRMLDTLSLIHISEPTRPVCSSRMPSSA